jgi:hypothetical protein
VFVVCDAVLQAEKDLPTAKDLQVAFVLADVDKSGAPLFFFFCISISFPGLC